jgi:single-stranded-DNA-specific exonuclease
MRRDNVSDLVWHFPHDVNEEEVQHLACTLKIPYGTAAIMWSRAHILGSDPISLFMPSDKSLNIIDLPLDHCVRRIVQAIHNSEKVTVYSDFDADGVTSAVVLKEALEMAGMKDVTVYFPSRFQEGYGFHPESVERLCKEGSSLFITSDCGITAHGGCEKALSMGADVIVTDHHLPGDKLPPAYGIIDPYLPSWEDFKLHDLTGAGVAYLLAKALLKHIGRWDSVPKKWATDLVTISIAGDSQPVLGVNRRFIQDGLTVLRECPRKGLAALCEVAGLGTKRVTGYSFDRDVTFGIVPRINASGRMDDAKKAFMLLTSEDTEVCRELAIELDLLNRERRELQETVLQEFWASDKVTRYAMVACNPSWHEGVLGIVASRVKEEVGRPAVLIAGEGHILKGSARGIPGLNIRDALERCSPFLEGFGGHEAAAGLSVRKENVERFMGEFDKVIGQMIGECYIPPSIEIDGVMELSDINQECLRSFFNLEPFGKGNPAPLVAALGLDIEEVQFLGKDHGHLAMIVSKGQEKKRMLWFGQGKMGQEISLMGKCDLVFTPYTSVFRGVEQFTPLIQCIRPSWEIDGGSLDDMFKCMEPFEPAILYTFSEKAADALVLAARKNGHWAIRHEVDTEDGLLEAQLVLNRKDGLVISTVPWALKGFSSSCRPSLLVVHSPLTLDALKKLLRWAEEERLHISWHQSWLQESLSWVQWMFPEKDHMESAWNFLRREFPDGRVPLTQLSRRWKDLSMCIGGTRNPNTTYYKVKAMIQGVIDILKDLGMVIYDERRKIPEVILVPKSQQVSLSLSSRYRDGIAARESVQKVWEEVARVEG